MVFGADHVPDSRPDEIRYDDDDTRPDEIRSDGDDERAGGNAPDARPDAREVTPSDPSA